MIDTAAVLKSWWQGIERAPSNVVRGHAIDPSRVSPTLGATTLVPEKHYFIVTINEMFLALKKEWFDTYDPMAIVVTEFSYGGKRIEVPFVVGPSMLEGKLKTVPEGMCLTDTKVAGITPYAGSSFDLTVVLARVKRGSLAKDLLGFAETVAGAFPAGVAMQPHLKVAGVVLESVQRLFGMADDVQPLAGHRWGYNPGVTPWLKPGFFALIGQDEQKIDLDALRVKDGRLLRDDAGGSRPYRENDFLLYSLTALETRSDVVDLPFYGLFRTALSQAASTDEGAWLRAAAGLTALHQQMVQSPDLLLDQVDTLIREYHTELHRVWKRGQDLTLMGETPAEASLHVPKELAALPDAARRAEALRTSQNFLKTEIE